MRVGIIDPFKMRCELIEVSTLAKALAAAGLQPEKVDHGTIIRDPGYGCLARVCYEWSLYVPHEKQRYFSVGRHLCAGPHVLYRTNDAGVTVNLNDMPPVMFFRDVEQAEVAIESNVIDRPYVAFGDKLLWSWPEPATDPFILERMRRDHAI